VAHALLEGFGGGVAAPSANRFGRVSPTTAAAVRAELGGEVDLVLDGGPSDVGIESTIVDCSVDEPRVLRVGGVTTEQLAEVLGGVPPVGGTTRAPGTLASHYSPRARVELVRGDGLRARADALVDAGERVGVLAERARAVSNAPRTVTLATPRDAEEYAHDLYAALRRADDLGLTVVLAVLPAEVGIGRAVADRLRRAAAPH
jgi:L-threonylcarbamoyladenylate synthase